MNKLMKTLGALGMGLVLSSVALASLSEDAIKERIKPVGELCLEGQECGAAAAAVASGPRSAEDIYNGKCMACHASGVAGAPKVGNAGDWAPRIDKGLETLISHAINGINAMPPRGTCADCSDEEIGSVVKYMVENSK